MSYFEDFIEPHIGELEFDYIHSECRTHRIKVLKITEKAYLLKFCDRSYDAWVPKVMVEELLDTNSTEASIYINFKLTPLNKEVELGVFKNV